MQLVSLCGAIDALSLYTTEFLVDKQLGETSIAPPHEERKGDQEHEIFETLKPRERTPFLIRTCNLGGFSMPSF